MDGCFPSLLPVRTVAPAALIDLDAAKVHLRVDGDDEDALIASYVAAATDRLDGIGGILGRCLMPQTWTASFWGFAGDRLRLPLRPVASITSVKYYDTAGTLQTFSAAKYGLLTDELGPYVRLLYPNIWPADVAVDRDNAVVVTFVAGYADAASVPAPIKAAILLMVGDLYANRETAVIGVPAAEIPMSTTVQALLAPYRAGSF